MSATRKFALWFGIIYLGAGVLGFVPAAMTPLTDANLSVTAFSGRLFGLFPVNFLHSLAHLALGAWGIAASRTMGGARAYAKALAWILGVFTIMGLIPGFNTVWGLVPLESHDIWLHAMTAIVAAWFGWGMKAEPMAKAAR